MREGSFSVVRIELFAVVTPASAFKYRKTANASGADHLDYAFAEHLQWAPVDMVKPDLGYREERFIPHFALKSADAGFVGAIRLLSESKTFCDPILLPDILESANNTVISASGRCRVCLSHDDGVLMLSIRAPLQIKNFLPCTLEYKIILATKHLCPIKRKNVNTETLGALDDGDVMIEEGTVHSGNKREILGLGSRFDTGKKYMVMIKVAEPMGSGLWCHRNECLQFMDEGGVFFDDGQKHIRVPSAERTRDFPF